MGSIPHSDRGEEETMEIEGEPNTVLGDALESTYVECEASYPAPGEGHEKSCPSTGPSTGDVRKEVIETGVDDPPKDRCSSGKGEGVRLGGHCATTAR